MKPTQFFDGLSLVHYLFVIALAYPLWHGIARNEPLAHEHEKARISVVNFFVAWTLAVLLLAFILHLYDPDSKQIPAALLDLCFLLWTLTIWVILWHSVLPAWAIFLSYVITSGAIGVHYLFPGGGEAFLTSIDEFVAFGGDSAGLKLSVLLFWSFYFVHVFVFTHYYGLMYEIYHREQIKRGERQEGLQEDAINRAVIVISMSLSFFVALVLVGTEVGKLSLFSGLVAAGVSIALKDLLANMAAGILLLWDKSIKLNDVISLDNEKYGVVQSMTIRYMVLEDRNDIRFLIPNSDLINRTITNWTQKTRNIRLKLNLGVSYDSDVEKVKDILKAVCLRNQRVLQDPPPRVLMLGLGDSTVNFQLRFFIADPENGIRNVMGELYESILERIKSAPDISIPFPQTEVTLLPESSIKIKVSEEVKVLSEQKSRIKRLSQFHSR